MNVTIHEFEPIPNPSAGPAQPMAAANDAAGSKSEAKKVEHVLRLLEQRRRRVRVY